MGVSSGDSNVIVPTNTKAILYPDTGSGDYTILFHFEGESSSITNLSTYISGAYINNSSVATVSLSSVALNVHPIQFGTTFITLVPKSGYVISPSRIPVYIYRYPKSGTALVTGSYANYLIKAELGSGISQMNDTFYDLPNLSEIDATKCPNVPICHGYPLDAIDPDYVMTVPCANESSWRNAEGWSMYSSHMKSDCDIQPTILKVAPQYSRDYEIMINMMIPDEEGELIVDWGDGQVQTLSGEYAYSRHTYNDGELKTITITPSEGTMYTLGDDDSYPLFGEYITDKHDSDDVHALKEITIGSNVIEICDCGITYDYDLNCDFTVPASVQRVGKYFMYECEGFNGIITVNTPNYPEPAPDEPSDGPFYCTHFLDYEADSPTIFGFTLDGEYADSWIQAFTDAMGPQHPLHNANVTEIWFFPIEIDLYDIELNLTSNYNTTFIVDWGDGTSQTLTGTEIHAPHSYSEDVPAAIIKIKANHDYTLGYYDEATWPDHNGLLGASDVAEGIMALVASKNVVGLAQWCCAFAGIAYLRFSGHSLTNIGNYAFYQTQFLKRVFLPDSLTTIGENAFAFSQLISFNMPDSVTSLGRDSLSYMDSLTSVVLSRNVSEIPICLFCFDMNLTSVTTSGRNDVALNVSSIGGGAFCNCRRLYYLSFSNNLTSLGCDAFAFCGYISGAYLQFSKLDHVPTITEDACEYGYGGVFRNTGGSSCVLCVPTSLDSAFRSAPNWSNYTDKIFSGSSCGPE